MPIKKYLNREKRKQEASAEDEWAHLTGIEEGPKLEVSDALDVQDRNIFISGKKRKPVSTTDIILEELEDTGHRTRTTDQYVRLVNAVFDVRLAEIEKIKSLKQNFDNDIDALRGESSEDIQTLTKIPFKNLKSKEVARLIKAMSEEKGNTESILEHHKVKATSLEKIIEEQGEKLKELDQKLKEKIVQEKETTEKKSVGEIQDELKILEELYGKDKLSQALKTLNSSESKK